METRRNQRARGGFTLVELLVVIAIIGVLVALLLPAVQSAREAARRSQCQNSLKNVALSVLNYTDAKGRFPVPVYAAPVTATGPKQLPNVVSDDNSLYKNWAIEILPYLEQQALYNQFQWGSPGAVVRLPNRGGSGPNAPAVATELAVFLCPSDLGNSQPYVGRAGTASWARGNYGLNSAQYFPDVNWITGLRDGTTAAPPKLVETQDFSVGMGVFEGREMKMARISDGTTNTIMLEEMRVGLSGSDRRGVWAMGMCGSNFHCRHATHGVSGVNSCNPGDDDVYQPVDIITEVGDGRLKSECMMPYPQADFGSGQSVVRSTHAGGAFGAMADGSVRFLSDYIQSGLQRGDVAYLGDDPNDLLEANFGVWQRLNVSADSYVVSAPQ